MRKLIPEVVMLDQTLVVEEEVVPTTTLATKVVKADLELLLLDTLFRNHLHTERNLIQQHHQCFCKILDTQKGLIGLEMVQCHPLLNYFIHQTTLSLSPGLEFFQAHIILLQRLIG
jgi:hypothetical protein